MKQRAAGVDLKVRQIRAASAAVKARGQSKRAAKVWLEVPTGRAPVDDPKKAEVAKIVMMHLKSMSLQETKALGDILRTWDWIIARGTFTIRTHVSCLRLRYSGWMPGASESVVGNGCGKVEGQIPETHADRRLPDGFRMTRALNTNFLSVKKCFNGRGSSRPNLESSPIAAY